MANYDNGDLRSRANGCLYVEWTCLDCGDGGVKVLGFPNLDERAWNAVRATHSRQNPGCTGGDDALRARVQDDDERNARLRAG